MHQDLAVGVEGKRNGKRAVACVGTDLKIAPNAQQAREERHEVGLLRRKQHVNPGQFGSLFANALQGGMLPSVRGVMAAYSTLVCRGATAQVAIRVARVRGVRYSGCSDERLLHPRKAGATWARL